MTELEINGITVTRAGEMVIVDQRLVGDTAHSIVVLYPNCVSELVAALYSVAEINQAEAR